MSDGFVPTHVAPAGGLRAWAAPDPAGAVIHTIDARVEMQVLELRGDWAHIECSNGWSAWVDARLLVSKHAAPTPPPASAPPTASTATVAAPATQRSRPSLPQVNLPDALKRPVMTVGGRQLIVADLIGPVGVVIGALLPWFRILGTSVSSFDVPLLFLVDNATDSDALKLAWLLIAAAGAALFAPEARFRQGGIGVALGASLLYVIQMMRLVSDNSGTSIGSLLGFGVYITILAAGAGLYLALQSRD